ncbi:LacI family DNA-binding transcriptional regulator [Homoserinibacter sp. YIM 151385]|uniref:LacI family DNA-binding transcriptional regulator n=1 Tax=Homoserinibacter sp. YIM 151385 TaxID=2985506 RepID=UPI0022F0CC95|nr:LacI family DNA-binding transcriptional regulator [Homoserinibacter sp. YIM 151385]WBU37503.1 LacI family DNA-binding transcriptional regulator [Homoserinibacter sp. YIM 151385]
MTVRLSDIADAAGVSVMTVSNVMNGKRARVSESTIARVQEIADRLGYVPNIQARSLKASRSHIVAALVPVREESSLLFSPHTVAVIGGIEQHLRHRGYHVLLRGIEQEGDIAQAIRGWSLDGAVLVEFADSEIDRIAVDGIPLVALDSYSANPRTIGVRTDDHRGGWLAGAALTGAGHRRLLFAGPPYEGMGVVGQRFEGFRSAVVAAGLDADSIAVERVLTSFEDGRELGLRLREDHPEATAVFATADVLAIGIMAGLAERGVRVPEELSIIGFDDLEISGYTRPALTTIAQDLRAKVAEAARIVLEEIEGGEGPRSPVTLGVELVERGTVAPPRRA